MGHCRKQPGEVPTRGAGFSLLELVLVAAIVAVMAAIAVPRFGSAHNRYRADLAARRIAADLAYLQAAARQGSRTEHIVFESNDERYALEDLADIDRPNQKYEVDLSDPQYGADLVSATFENSDGYVSTTRMSFDMWGRPQCGDPPGNPMAPLAKNSIVLQVGSETRRITVDPVCGRASIQ